MGTTLINRTIAAKLATLDQLAALQQGRMTELLLQTGAKLIVVPQGAVRRYAIFGYAADGSDRNLAALLG